MRRLTDFREITFVDWEYGRVAGKVTPVCCCAKELRSGRQFRIFLEELVRHRVPPYAAGRDVLFVSFSAHAELSCYLPLHWPMPPNILDLCIELRWLVNGVWPKHRKRSLVEALKHFGLPEIVDKEKWHGRILQGAPFTAEERAGIIDYCMQDVDGAIALLEKLLPYLPTDLRYALLRGRYAIAAADMEARGIPADGTTWNGILEDKEAIQRALTTAWNRIFPLYDESLSFKFDAFEGWLASVGLLERWPRTPRSGRLASDNESFKKFAGWHPQVEQLRQVRQTKQLLDRPAFDVVGDRNYYGMRPFGAETTSRNSTNRCIFQAPSWTRALIQPAPGRALLYIDYAQEEFLIAGVLSKDEAILEAYRKGDPYVNYAAHIGLAPADATKKSHPKARDLAKVLLLAINYGQTAYGLAGQLKIPLPQAEELLATNRRGFKTMVAWSDEMVRVGRWTGHLETLYRWRLTVGPATKENTLRNFLVQATGAEVLRLANLFMWEAGLAVCAPVHDAFLLEANDRDVEAVQQTAQRCMERASETILQGYRLRTDTRVLRNCERLVEDKGVKMWNFVQRLRSRLAA